MSKLFTFLPLVFLCFNMPAQTPAWTWAKSAAGSESEIIKGVASDNSGNACITGNFLSPEVVFGAFTLLNNNTFTAVPSSDMFLVKYSSAGEVLWAAQAGGTSGESGNAIAIDGEGNVYVAGTFMSQAITFGPYTLSKSNNSEDIFIVKYDRDGNVLWAKSALGDQQDVVSSIAVDNNGNLYIAGFSGSGTLTIGSTVVTNSMGFDFIYLAKYDVNGNFAWIQQATGNGSNIASSVTTDMAGNAYITGYYSSGCLSIGGQSLTNINLTQSPIANAEGYDMFAARFDTAGGLTWAKSFGATGDEIGNSLFCSGNNIYLGGSFSSPTVGMGAQILTNMDSSGQTGDLMLLKMDNSGNIIWAGSGAGAGADYMHAIAGTPAGNIVLAGHYGSTLLSFGSQTVSSSGSDENIFVAQYDSDGNALWVTGIGGGGNEEGTSVATNTMGDIYAAGYYTSGSIMVGTVTLNNSSSYTTSDIFLAKMAGNAGITSVSSAGSQIAVYPNPSNGNVVIDLGQIKERDLTITVYNGLGGKVFEKEIYTNERMQSLDLSATPKGAYVLKIKILAEVYTRKIIIR